MYKKISSSEKKRNGFHKKLSFALADKNVKLIREIVLQVDEQDLANWLDSEPSSSQVFFIRSLDNVTASEVFNLLSEETASNIISTFTEKETGQLLSYLYSDDLVDLVEELPSSIVKRILKSISSEQRQEINYILNYSDEVVGSEMNVNFISLKITDKISDAINLIRSTQKKKIPEENQYHYVVDDRGLLIGYVSTKDLLISTVAEGEKRISTIIETDIVSVRAFDNKEAAFEKIQKYEIGQLPVVDQQNKLIGVLNVEQLLEIIKEEHSEDITKGAGIIDESDKGYFKTSIWTHFKGRLPWLLVTLVISTITQIIFSFFMKKANLSPEFAWTVFIIPFLPFIFATVGNIALQSTAIIVKNITLNEIKHGNYRYAFLKEIKITIITLFCILFINFFRKVLIDFVTTDANSFWDSFTTFAKFWKEYFWISFVILYSVILSLLFSVGLPILADYSSHDPALMSSPLLTTLIDLVITSLALWSTYMVFV